MNCSECNFYQAIRSTSCLPLSQRFGECRLHPPRVVATSNPREHKTLAAFPIVSEHDWCGEFVAWPAPLGERATNQANAAFDAAAHDDAPRGPLAARTGQCQPLPERSPGCSD
ncbi:hypothetical protein SH139x_002806 [Planctomycetaceae bacterium SH139]